MLSSHNITKRVQFKTTLMVFFSPKNSVQSWCFFFLSVIETTKLTDHSNVRGIKKMKQPLQRTEKPCVMCVQYFKISYANYTINLSQAEILTSHKSYSTTFDPCSMDLKSFIPLEKAYNMTSLRRVFRKKKRNLTNLFSIVTQLPKE